MTTAQQTVTLYAEYNSGAAITEGHARLLVVRGIDHGRRVLTADEFAAISAYAATRPSTPGNNVWD